ncbi:MAG: transposase zinc-binding domain-containing protein [Rubrivivax sp.]|nr:transposase zinc-binding domain-containing protein [Rubrivivax sp.]
MQAIGRQPQRAQGGAPVHYERHRPEQTALYRLVQQHAATFIAETETEAAAGADLPQFVKDEFDAFLDCGILAHGFLRLRLRCGDCGHDKLVAFSCKRRGICPSCGARRMAQTAAHLVDHVIPHVPVRQWVLSLPDPAAPAADRAALAGDARAAGGAPRDHAPPARTGRAQGRRG